MGVVWLTGGEFFAWVLAWFCAQGRLVGRAWGLQIFVPRVVVGGESGE